MCRAAMDVGDTGMAAVDAVRSIFVHFYPGSSRICKRVFGNCREIAGRYQVCQMLRCHLLVLGVLIDGGSYVIKILFKDIFITRAFLVGASCHEEQRKYYD